MSALNVQAYLQRSVCESCHRVLRGFVRLISTVLQPAFLVAAILGVASTAVSRADTLEDFRLRQQKVKAVLKKALPTTVAITSKEPGGTGSGVVISAEGLILTAAHVTEATGDELTIIFPNGRRAAAKALGANRTLDAGLARITDEGPWPHSEIGNSDIVAMGSWCVALGHPGGFMPERPPPVRIGRIWHRDHYGAIYSDCTLIGGDSGGPLFDLNGRVIGIHSSIGGALSTNRHVATDSFRLHWDRMLNGEQWGTLHLDPDQADLASMGVELDWSSQNGALVRAVRTNAPAAAAGVQRGDLIVSLAGESITSSIQLLRKLARMEPGEQTSVTVQRSGDIVDMEVTLTDHKSLTSPPIGDEEPVPDSPYLGVEVDSSETGDGALVTAVSNPSPAATAGIVEGDIITAIGIDSVETPDSLVTKILERQPGDTVEITIERDGTAQTLKIKLARQ